MYNLIVEKPSEPAGAFHICFWRVFPELKINQMVVAFKGSVMFYLEGGRWKFLSWVKLFWSPWGIAKF